MIGSCEIKVSDTFPSKMGTDILQERRDDAVVGRGDGANRVMVVYLRWHVITELKGGESRHLWHGLRWRGIFNKMVPAVALFLEDWNVEAIVIYYPYNAEWLVIGVFESFTLVTKEMQLNKVTKQNLDTQYNLYHCICRKRCV